LVFDLDTALRQIQVVAGQIKDILMKFGGR
jgi:hypothetical protein